EPERAKLIQVGSQILTHVEGLHALGIVHGAIHGRNVIVRPDGGVTLTHVSPLLYHEMAVDVEALKELMARMGFEVENAGSVKEWVGVSGPVVREERKVGIGWVFC